MSRGTPPSRHLPGLSPAAMVTAGLALLGLAVLLGRRDPARFFHAYLAAWLFGISLGVGALLFVLIQFAARAGWSVAIRRLAEHVMTTVPVFAVAALPLAFGLGFLYPSVEPAGAASRHAFSPRGIWLDPAFLLSRSLVYLAGWSAVAVWFRRRSLMQDRTRDPRETARLRVASAPALVWMGISLTLAAFDWIMALAPGWYSTIFGVYFFAGSMAGSLSLLALGAAVLVRTGPARDAITAEHLHDLGKLLFAFVAFWAYIAFSQYMLIWYADLPEETAWLARRLGPGWKGIATVLAVGHFVLPFFFFLSRRMKRRPAALAAGAAWVLLMHYLDLFWQVMPQVDGGPRYGLLELACFGGICLLGAGIVLNRSARSSLIATGDPLLKESLSFHS